MLAKSRVDGAFYQRPTDGGQRQMRFNQKTYDLILRARSLDELAREATFGGEELEDLEALTNENAALWPTSK